MSESTRDQRMTPGLAPVACVDLTVPRATEGGKYAKEGKLKQVPFAQRAEMQKLVDPVMAAYAKEVGADAIYAKINSLK